ncbi:MAG: hypothetical protein IT196_08445 [Acidimicrobiales bacterium]|nr:hypothetical protein [Acidimicrobiales bacterium]
MEVRFPSGDLELVGHLAAPPGGSRSRPGLVLCHGFPSIAGAGNAVMSTLPGLADRLAASHGWAALAYAARGCRPSQGEFSLGGWLADVHAAVAALRAEVGVAGVWLAGFGRGGALAICAAAADPSIRGVIAFAPPADFDDWASQPRRLLEFARRAAVVHDQNFPRNFDQWSAELRSIRTVACAEKVYPRPLMVIHGLADVDVPVFDARVVADAHSSAELRVISGASHDLRLDPRAIAVLFGWLDRQWNQYQANLPR